MKFVALVGSIRKESYNKKLAKYIKIRYQEKAEIDILPIENLPLFNQDEEENPPAVVEDFKQKVADSDGLIFVTPEYNHSVPGVLKNAIDWCSRVDKVMVKKPAMIAGGSIGVLGTARAQMHLRQILNSPGVSALTLPGNEVFIGGIQNKMDDDGILSDESTIEFIDNVMNNFIDWVDKTKRL
ncbi:NADPH-dependent FMN reductase [Salinibacillus xinjiangensis]|uniref:NADPH-dependent FMN reductase n=1 Tax=Salinibacillus xinjiangensis TaxID=1229268 RepID=A0A6G1XAY1_9BACI|nr:NADPH-dependent FMN reductase [Salinibacillus xinjiangensis]MRG88097.1 NADPH-dependent FMN reductase [Salinibacillus xinjiangensis]